MMSLGDVLDQLQRYPHPRVKGHRPDYDAILALLVKSFLCRKGHSFEHDPKDLLVGILNDNYMTDFIYSSVSHEIYEYITFKLKMIFPEYTPYSRRYSFEYNAIEVKRFGTVFIHMTEQHWHLVTQKGQL